MPAQRTFGMDHPHHEWSPITSRPALRWPGDAPVALCVILVLEHMEWQPPEGSFQVANLAGGSAPRAFPDYARLSHREYGHRVGIFRLLDILEKHGIPATIAMDAITADNYPYLVRHCLDRGCEIIGHGVSVSRMITSNMSESAERAIHSLFDRLRDSRHRSGSDGAGSARSMENPNGLPRLLAEAGIGYVCDWANDEQPYAMTAGNGPFFALPLLYELDDVASLAQRKVTVSDYQRRITESFDILREDGASNARLMALNWHPWLVGQPFRVRAVDSALEYLMKSGSVWAATGSEIIEWYRTQTA